MKKTLLAALVLLVALTGSSCLIVDDSNDFFGYDFNGVWTFAFTGCQGQVGNITISQSGSSFVMSSSSGLVWYGSCDPFAGTFAARADGRGWSWAVQGGTTSLDTLAGGYHYAEFGIADCGGSFTAQRIGFRDAAVPEGRPVERLP